MDLMFGIGYQAHKYAEKIAPTDAGRALRYGGNVASEVVRYTHHSIPRALVWAAGNALYTGVVYPVGNVLYTGLAYIPATVYSVVAMGYNAAWRTQTGGMRAGNRHWYNHWKRPHLMDDATNAPRLRYPLTMPKPRYLSWATVAGVVPGPHWRAPEYPAAPAAPAAPDTFDPMEQYAGLKDRSPQGWARYNRWVSNGMVEDAEAIGLSIRTEVFPALNPDGTPHPQAGQFRYANLRSAYQAANLADRALRAVQLARAGVNVPANNLRAVFMGVQATAAAQEAGFANAAEAVTARNAHMDHLLELNAMNMTNILQRRFESEEVEYTLKLILKMHWKGLYYEAKWGYLEYKSAHRDEADKTDARLRGLLQEVDPLHGRKQGVPMSL